MKLSEYGTYDALGLAELIRKREVTPCEVAQCALDATEAFNPHLNAVLETYQDRVDDSKMLEFPADDAPALAGVPMMLKDIGAAEEGRKQELASAAFKGRVSPSTSNLTKRFREAGLVNLGRTALPELGMVGLNAVSELNPATVNPWNTDYQSGSSSGGAGAVVASGIVPIGHASDIGGSTRHPAAICGAIGLKTSRGRITLGPDFTDYPIGTLNEFAVTRSVRDTAALLDAVEGPFGTEPRTVEAPVEPFSETVARTRAAGSLKQGDRPLRVGLCLEHFAGLQIDGEVEAAVRNVAKLLEGMGAEVTEAAPKLDYQMILEADMMCAGAFLTTAIKHITHAEGIDLDYSKFSPDVTAMIEGANAASAVDLFEGLEGYNEIRRQVYDYFGDFDLMVSPIMGCQSQKAELFLLDNPNGTDEDWAHHYSYLVPFNISGNPAISVPASMSSTNMPIGVQLVAPFGRDDTVLAAAALLEDAIGWQKVIAPLHSSRL